MSTKKDKMLSVKQAAKLLGHKGGRARASKLTAEQRSAIARKAARTRWDREKDREQVKKQDIH
jgi:hypothetical protein